MSCAKCSRLSFTAERLESVYLAAVKLMLSDDIIPVHYPGACERASDALLRLRMAQARLDQHQRESHN